MKTSHVITLLAILITFGVSSCSKKSDDIAPGQTTTTNPAQVGFQVKVDGKVYAPDFAYALASSPGDDGYYAIYGLDSKTSDVVVLGLPKTTVEGTYPMNNVNVGMLSLNKQDFSTVNGGTGTITITKKTATNLTGTFSFTAYDVTATVKRTLTEGTFNVNIR